LLQKVLEAGTLCISGRELGKDYPFCNTDFKNRNNTSGKYPKDCPVTYSISFKPASRACFAARALTLSYAILLLSLREEEREQRSWSRSRAGRRSRTGGLEAGLSKEKCWANGMELRMLPRRAAAHQLTPTE